MPLCLLSIIIDRMIQTVSLLAPHHRQPNNHSLLQFVIPRPSNTLHQLVELGPNPLLTQLPNHLQQHSQLTIIMATDLRLDRLRTRHGRLPTHHGRRPAQDRGRHLPDRIHGRGSDAMLGQQVLEGPQMARFLVIHAFHQRPQRRMRACYQRRLRLVDQRCGQFAGVVNS